MGSNTRVAVYLRESAPEEAREIQESVLARLRALASTGTINQLSVSWWGHQVRSDTPGGEQAITAYDDFDTWQSIHQEFDAFGTFNNGFTGRKGIDTP